MIGAGQMGSGIAEVSAKAGAEVVVYEPTDELITAGSKRITASLERMVSKGKLAESDRDATLARLTFTTDLSDLWDRQLVIEAVVEDEAVKGKIFAALDEIIIDPDAVLASNTSSIPIMKIAAATKNPSRVLGLHFFNPVPVLPLVELINTLVTSDEAVARTEEFASGVLGKKVVRCGDRSGFIVNALLIPYLISAIRMYEEGFATREAIDEGMKLGCGHPMGPLTLSDFIGLDVVAAVGYSLYDEFRRPEHAPPPLLRRMVSAGRLGRKSGHGFYEYQRRH